jgi:hypothetical protein
MRSNWGLADPDTAAEIDLKKLKMEDTVANG